MKNTLKNALEIENKGGAVLASTWVNGSGNYITRRPVPQFCREVEKRDVSTLPGKTRRTAERLLKNHPRAQKLVCVVDRRGLNAAVKVAAIA